MQARYIALLMLLSTTLFGPWQHAGALMGSFDPSLTIAGVQCINVSGSPIASIPALIEENRFSCDPLAPTNNAPIAIVITGSATSDTVQGEVDESLSLTSVTCTNVTNSTLGGTSGAGLLTGSAFQCPALLIEPNDTLVITLAGSALTDSGDCFAVEDVETENPEEFPLLTFNGLMEQCATITGNISEGFIDPFSPNPNTDADLYLLILPFVNDVTSAQLTMSISTNPATQVSYGIFDEQARALVNCSQTPKFCQGSLERPDGLLAITTQNATSYTLTIRVSASTTDAPMDGGTPVSSNASRRDAMGSILQQHVLDAIR